TLDPLSQAEVDAAQDRATLRKLEVMNSFTHEPSDEKPRNLIFRFLVSPTELLGDENGQLTGVRMVHNELYQTDNGTLRPRATDRYEEIPAGLLFRSIGYRGVPVPGVPFHERWGV
ncbi:MAG: hypothetical protein KDE28_29420, partial [Anaerolineales bacterium]|nr:hypothetical protein [Anaerolineales bacterium]